MDPRSQDTFDLNRYLGKVGCSSRPEISADGLFELHTAQFFSIPFENLDIQLGREIPLSEEALVEKLIHRNRGGYCFELNGILLIALTALGFDAKPVLCRVHLGARPSARTHLIACVRLGAERWIVDAGFGAGGPRMPLLLQDRAITRSGNFAYRLYQDSLWGWVLETLEDGAWKTSYSFDLGHVTHEDIECGNFFTSHSLDTHFTRIRTVSLPTETGRISLRNQTLTRIEKGQKTTETLPEGKAYVEALAEWFGIELDAEFEDFKPLLSA